MTTRSCQRRKCQRGIPIVAYTTRTEAQSAVASGNRAKGPSLLISFMLWPGAWQTAQTRKSDRKWGRRAGLFGKLDETPQRRNEGAPRLCGLRGTNWRREAHQQTGLEMEHPQLSLSVPPSSPKSQQKPPRRVRGKRPPRRCSSDGRLASSLQRDDPLGGSQYVGGSW